MDKNLDITKPRYSERSLGKPTTSSEQQKQAPGLKFCTPWLAIIGRQITGPRSQ